MYTNKTHATPAVSEAATTTAHGHVGTQPRQKKLDRDFLIAACFAPRRQGPPSFPTPALNRASTRHSAATCARLCCVRVLWAAARPTGWAQRDGTGAVRASGMRAAHDVGCVWVRGVWGCEARASGVEAGVEPGAGGEARDLAEPRDQPRVVMLLLPSQPLLALAPRLLGFRRRLFLLPLLVRSSAARQLLGALRNPSNTVQHDAVPHSTSRQRRARRGVGPIRGRVGVGRCGGEDAPGLPCALPP